jgi:hypothetical protein
VARLWTNRSPSIAAAAVRQPEIGKMARPSRRHPVRFTSASDSQPPARHDSPPKNSGMALISSDFSKDMP